MKRSVWFGLVVAAGLFASSAVGQPTPPVNTLQSDQSSAAPNKAAVHQFVTEQFAAIEAADTHNAALKRLVVACPRGATPAYYAIYGAEVNTAALAALADGKPVNVKVAAGVAIHAVALNGQTLTVHDATIKALSDREPSVALWGVKTARSMIDVMVVQPSAGKNDLAAAIVTAIDQHPGTTEPAGAISGALAQDAYDALAARNAAAPNPASLSTLFDETMNLLEARTKQYAKYVPSTPSAEIAGAVFLNKNKDGLTPVQKARFIQVMVNLEYAMGQRSALIANDKVALNQLRDAVVKVGQALQVAVGQDVPSVSAVIKLPPGSAPAAILKLTDSIPKDVQNIIHDLKLPAPLPVIEPTTAPAK